MKVKAYNVNKTDKIIAGFYVVLAVSFASSIIYLDYSIPHPPKPTFIMRSEQIHEITFSKTVDVNKTKIFDVMGNLQDYPLVFPRYILSSTIINQTNNVEYAEERIVVNGIMQKFVVKHTLVPYTTQTLEILSGDAKGTVIAEQFEGNDTVSTMTTDVKLHLQGLLEPFAYVEAGIMQNQLDQALDKFVVYTKEFDNNPIYKTVDQLYREILKRPADPQGLQYYGSMLDSGKMTTDDIRNALLASDEYKSLPNMTAIKSVDELQNATKNTIDQLYREILKRPADPQGLQYYGSMLENGKMTTDDIRKALLGSKEYASLTS